MPSGLIVGRLVLISLPLYFAWEMVQMPAFIGTPAGWVASTLLCAFATVLDAALVLALYGIGVWAFRDRLWFGPPRAGRYVVVVLLAIVANSLWEWLTVVRLGLWGYSAWHPTVAGIGLVAILQAVVVPSVVFILLARWVAHDAPRVDVDSRRGGSSKAIARQALRSAREGEEPRRLKRATASPTPLAGSSG